MDIKSLPTQYILKRWTREARCGIVQDNQGRNIIENPKLDDMLRYKDMSRKFLNVAQRAASYPRCTLLVHNTLDMLSKQVEEEINSFSSVVDPVIVPTNVAPPIDLASTTSLKKKEVKTKNSKRKRNWLDKKRKVVKNGGNKKGKCSKEQETRKMIENSKTIVDDGVTVQNISPSTSVPKEEMSELYMAINTFSQLFTGAITDDVIAEF